MAPHQPVLLWTGGRDAMADGRADPGRSAGGVRSAPPRAGGPPGPAGGPALGRRAAGPPSPPAPLPGSLGGGLAGGVCGGAEGQGRGQLRRSARGASEPSGGGLSPHGRPLALAGPDDLVRRAGDDLLRLGFPPRGLGVWRMRGPLLPPPHRVWLVPHGIIGKGAFSRQAGPQTKQKTKQKSPPDPRADVQTFPSSPRRVS